MSNFQTILGAGFNWYGFLIGGGMVICIIISYFMAKKRGYYSDLIFDIAIITIPMAIIGARLYYVIFDALEGGHWTFAKILGIGGEGLRGLAIYGGLIGAVLGGIIVAALQKRKPKDVRVSFWQMADLAFTVIILGQAIGRWGNFANQEAHGAQIFNPSWQFFPIAVNINGLYYQATFFYESLWNAIGFCMLMWMYNGKRKSFDGFILSMYCIFYGVGRFFIEGLRTDSLMLGIFRVSQLVSVAIILFGVSFILYHIYRAREDGKKPFLFVPQSKLNSDYLWFEKSVFARPPKPIAAYDEAETIETDVNADVNYENNDETDENYIDTKEDKIEATINKDELVKINPDVDLELDGDLIDGYNGEDFDEIDKE